MNKAEPTALAWRTSSYSSGNGQCVEVAPVTGAVATRDSKDRGGPVLTFQAGAWASFVETIKAGGFLEA